MTELYVYSEGNKPKAVVVGRQEAVRLLVAESFPTTAAEKKAINLFLEGNLCELGTGLLLVGYPPEVPDRRLTRVVGAFGASH
jgi:hypothetical protein